MFSRSLIIGLFIRGKDFLRRVTLGLLMMGKYFLTETNNNLIDEG